MTISIYATLDFLCSRHIFANTVHREMVLTQRKTEWNERDAFLNKLV